MTQKLNLNALNRELNGGRIQPVKSLLKWSVLGLASVLSLATLGCANGPCRQLRDPELAARQAASTQAGTTQPPVNPESPVASAVNRETSSSSGGKVVKPVQNDKETVFVYKADGSKQCEPGTGSTADAMEKKELGGIKVLSRDKRPDGRMHIQMCGTPTGMINVFEIPKSALKDAEARGFKKLDK